MSSDFDLGSLESSNGGLDAFLGDNPGVTTPLGLEKVAGQRPPPSKATGRTKVASLEQLSGFIRTAEDQLIHKSDRDLWSLRKDAQGDFYVERMFDETGAPLKG
jgi:hypothetical protein